MKTNDFETRIVHRHNVSGDIELNERLHVSFFPEALFSIYEGFFPAKMNFAQIDSRKVEDIINPQSGLVAIHSSAATGIRLWENVEDFLVRVAFFREGGIGIYKTGFIAGTMVPYAWTSFIIEPEAFVTVDNRQGYMIWQQFSTDTNGNERV